MTHKSTPFLALLLGLLLGTNCFAQRGASVGSWTPYLSYEFVKKVIRNGDIFYCNTGGGYYTWKPETNEIKTYSPIDGLSDVDASSMHYDSASNTVFLGFENGAINYFKAPFGEVNYLTDIQRTDLFTSKRINEMVSRNGLLYIGTEFGVVIFDIEKEETRSSVTKVGTNPTGTPCQDLIIVEDTIYLCMGNGGLWSTYIDQPNITIPTVWNKANRNRGMGNGEAEFVTAVGDIVYTVVGDSTYTKFPGQNWTIGPMPHLQYDYYEAHDSLLYGGYNNYIRVHLPDFAGQYLILAEHGSRYAFIDSQYTLYSDPVTTMRWVTEPDTFIEVGPDGPQNNIITQLAVGNGEVYIAPRGQAGATSAPLNTSDGFFYYNRERGWKNFNVEDELSRDSIFEDFARVYLDQETGTAYVGSWGEGVLVTKDGEVVKNYTSSNSNISPSFTQFQSGDTRVSGIAKDQNGVVWATAILADFNLNALTPEGDWERFNIANCFPVQIIVDDWNNKWIINNGIGLTVFNDNGTIENRADDQVKYFTTSRGNGGLPTGTVTSIAKDRNGNIWVGTLEGVAVFANPSRVFQSSYPDASCPVIDGFCLLRDQRVTAIAVDGANRKWIGTESGIYVVNPQGNRLLKYYSTENSPLFSDDIRDIEIDQQTGEIFIGTSKGLLSLMGEAIGGKENSEELYVFPNPVFTDYDGPVSITCSVADAEVRITTASGRLVKALDALGGQAVWDGRDEGGNRIAPGIYLAMVTDSDGKNAGIAKFVVVEKYPNR